LDVERGKEEGSRVEKRREEKVSRSRMIFSLFRWREVRKE